MNSTKKVYIQEYIGLVNRLETLTLAFAIQQRHGHQVLLDWPELDALVIQGTTTQALGWGGRFGSLRLRLLECSPEVFSQLGQHHKILLRTYIGPDEDLDRLYRETIAKIRIQPFIASEVRQIFATSFGRPVVGVHMRRGDYPLIDSDEYDTNAVKHPAVPLWWYERAMEALQQHHPDVLFYLSFSGNGAEFQGLRKNFDIIEAMSGNPYNRVGTGHDAQKHPVIDLFALASCSVLLATPLSSFSYYAGHVFGPPSVTILPPTKVLRSHWEAAQLDPVNGRLVGWTNACRSGEKYRKLATDLSDVHVRAANTDWLPEV
ncbi:MAG: hypothetical protein ORN51_13960 [Akkermansiaceae bacterium]|nr:hypothetical protein [Akkermansiaceae bacterium]